MCIKTNNFSWNLTTCRMYARIPSLLTPDSLPGRKNRRLMSSSRPIRSNNHVCPSTGMRVRWSCKKFQPERTSVGLSHNDFHGTSGIFSPAYLLPQNNKSSSINYRHCSTNPCTMLRNWAMLNWMFLYNISSWPCHPMCPMAVVL